MQIGAKEFDFSGGTAYIMGILNITPDSFSDGGQYNTVEAALHQVEILCEQGADIIDIGAESTRPGHTQISTQEEIRRLLPILQGIRRAYPELPLSVDCYRTPTAAAAIEAGANLINDIWGLTYDKKMAPLIAQSKVAVCIMHNRNNTTYGDFFPEMFQDLDHMLSLAKDAGIPESHIILDPGVGFGKTFTHNLLTLKYLSRFKSFNLPILLGTSRKGFIGKLLNKPPQERDIGTATTTVHGYLQGARMFRVHNVSASRQALDTLLAIEGV